MVKLLRIMPVFKGPFLLVLIVVFGAALRIYQIDRESLWLDEAFSYWMARSTPSDILIASATSETNPPLYFLALHYWIKVFGESDKAIRLLSATFGALAIPVVYRIGQLLFNERLGLLAALFLSVSGFHIQYSQEARAYSLYFFVAALSVYFSTLFYKRRTLSRSIGYIITTALLLYSHDTGLFTFAAVVCFYLVLAKPVRLASVYPFFAVTAIALLMYAPYIPAFMNHAASVKSGFWASGLTVANVLAPIQKLILFPEKIAGVGPIQYALIVVPICVLCLALPTLWVGQKRRLIALALLFIVPVGINLLISLTIRNIFIPRSLICGLLPLPLFWASPVLISKEGLFCRYRNLGLLAMFAMFLILLGGSIEFLRHNSKEPWRQAAAIFQRNYKAGDRIVYLFGYSEIALRRYLPDAFNDIPVTAIPHRSSFFLAKGQPPNNKAENSASRVFENMQSPKQRFWIVMRQETGNKVLNDTKAWLDTNYLKVGEWDLGSPELHSKLMSPVTLQVFVRK
jgi:mannosyltransferase